MNVLDENVPEDQRGLLQSWGIPIHQIGHDVAQKGLTDREIIPFLHDLRDTTFFTRDRGFYDRRLCHPRYCLVCLAVEKNEVAVFVRRLLRHPELDTKAKRMGAVVRVSHMGLSLWRREAQREVHIEW
ncbi:MAG: hypothetical protein FJ279_02725 [Planctomycetes bacterium]|nr:hypothetical protein [Planctomycetota bacterium]MBM4079946.1 hypothetical protein [Planctomycetota bacterium]MBM4086215.1 hypothetical protein [Planctomycetota bacterium]